MHGLNEIGPIYPSRGIRQGDPLSPYLFIICAEGLSSLLRKYEERNWLLGVKICRRAPVISHMLFADDSYLYCRADTNDATKVMEVLYKYEKASVQRINKEKSFILFSTNVIQYNMQGVCQLLQMNEATEHSTYLGLPNLIGRNKSALLGFLRDKVTTRVRSWDGKFVSRSGKETLIKSVAQTMPTYSMNVFLIPLEIVKDIEICLTKFWWNTSQPNKNNIHWMSWDRMTKHKKRGRLSGV